MTTRWRLSELAGEAVRNVRAGPLSAVLVGAVVAVAIAAGTVVEANAARAARTQLRSQVVDGAWVTVARAGGGIDATACRRVAHQPAVLAAGGVGKPASVALSAAPGTLFEAYPATPELVDVLAARGQPLAVAGHVAVGASLAHELGLVDGSQVVVVGRGLTTVTLLPESVRTARFSRALVIPEQLALVDECWVEWVPGTADVRALTEALLPGPAPLNVSATLTANAYSTDPFAQYQNRWTRWWSLPVGLLAALVVSIALRSRSRQAALYAALGTGRAELAVLFGLEISIVVSVGAAVGTSWGLALFAGTGEVTTFDVLVAARSAGFVPAVVVLATVLLLLARRSRIAHELKAE